jgi:MerR family transcriptional regulator, thiopeptide resistance regulator
MEWSIQDVARLASTTSRTLRHYGEIGLLEASRIGSNGYRYYDERALTRLQRILLLRELGLGLPAVAEVLDGQRDDTSALLTHLEWLTAEKSRVDHQIASVQKTITKLKGGEQLMAEEMFNGFDHTQYKGEVEEKWGKEAYAKGNAWWSSKSAAEKKEWQHALETLGAAWIEAAASGIAPDGAEAQALAQRQFEWLKGIPGTPGGGTTGPTREYFIGLGEMYVADPRFAANYGGQAGAEFVRDAMAEYAKRNL